MSLEDLRQQYLWIAKNSLAFLKEKGFQKKGNKYFKQKGIFILEIYSIVPRAWINSEDSYNFTTVWEIYILDLELIKLFI
jgi:hypothetical protein